jgi:ABC-2 type transport system permease protein
VTTAPLAPMLLHQTRTEFLKLWRTPAFSATSLALPVMFFAFFGLPAVGRSIGGVDAGAYLLGSFAAYAVLNVMLFSFGITVAVERAQNQDALMRASPLSPAVYLTARVLTALVFALLTLVALFLFAALVGGVRLTAATWLELTGRLLLGSLPFIALGFTIGFTSDARAAPGVINLIYLPMALASGLFVPINQLPGLVQLIAPLLPVYRYAQLAWGALGAATEPLGTTLLWLAAWTVVLFGLAIRAYGRVEAEKFS